MNVAVIYGGGSSEQASSLKSAQSIFKSISNIGHSPYIFEFNNNIQTNLTENKIDFVFIASQGKKCGDGTLQAFLDRHDVKYTGSNMTASAICNDKIICKKLMEREGILTPRYTTFTAKENYLEKIHKSIGFPCVVKAPHEGSSYGLDFVNNVDEIDKIPPLFSYDDLLIAEERVKGIDLTLPILEKNGELTFLPLIEIRPRNGLNTTFSKFTPGQIEYPKAIVSNQIINHAQSVSKLLFNTVGASGYARVDMILSDNNLYVLEINGVPGLSDESIFPEAAALAGMRKDELIGYILQSAYNK